jgi:hypothetical protein
MPLRMGWRELIFQCNQHSQQHTVITPNEKQKQIQHKIHLQCGDALKVPT